MGARMISEWTSRLKLWRVQKVGKRVKVLGRVWVHGDGEVELGDDVVLDARAAPIEIRTAKGGKLTLGDGVRVEGGASLESEGRLVIGRGVTVRPFAKIIDNHFHPLTGDRNQRAPPGEVVLEDGVVIEAGAIVLPGAHVGAGSLVAPRAVVSKRVPPGMRVVGNPAKVEPLVR